MFRLRHGGEPMTHQQQVNSTALHRHVLNEDPLERHQLLALAYTRPCCICEVTGWCRHREPEVELALMAAGGRG